MKTIKFNITGISPLIMHNGSLSDRRNKYASQMKVLNAKKLKRTESDFDEIERLEWEGGLWTHDGKPCLPADAVHAIVIGGARKTKSGKTAEAGVWCDEPAIIKYQGPRIGKSSGTIPDSAFDALYADSTFVDQRGVRLQRVRITRTRPIFRQWSATVTLVFDPRQCDEANVREWIVTAGEQIGIGDYRPRFGRFTVE